MKTISLCADEGLIEAARKRAESESTTLDEQLQQWLAQYAAGAPTRPLSELSAEERRRRADDAMRFLDEMATRVKTGGRKFTREELNER